MFPRALEVLLIALLVMVTLGVAFQIQNHLLLREMLTEFRRPPQQVVISTPGATQPGTPPQSLTPAPQPQYTHEAPHAQPAPSRNPQPNTQPAPQPTLPPQPEPPTATTGNTDNPAAATTAKPEPAVVDTTATTPAIDGPERLTPDQAEEWKTFGPTITDTVTDLVAGRYDDVRARFNRDMSRELTRSLLASVIEPIRAEHGDLKRILYHRPVDGGLPQNMHTWELNVELTSGHQMLFTVTVDQQKKVAGLYMR